MKTKGFLRNVLSMALLVAGASAAAWAGDQQPQLENRSRNSGNQILAQKRLEKQVLHELRMLPYYSVFDNLEFRVRGYRVELLGQVRWSSLKSDAEAAVRKLEAVESVDNKIEVLPLSPNDDRIRRAVFRAIYSHSVLQRYAIQPVPPVHIIVKNGHVTLVGVVATRMESNVANIQANSVPGAFSVTNKLRVEKG